MAGVCVLINILLKDIHHQIQDEQGPGEHEDDNPEPDHHELALVGSLFRRGNSNGPVDLPEQFR